MNDNAAAAGAVTVWGRTTSVNVQKVLWVLAELGHDCVRHDVGGPFGGLDDPDFVAMNPNQQIPVLQDGPLTLWESNAIVRHLARTRGQGSLMPGDPAGVAVADQWMDWVLTSLYPSVITAMFHQLVRTTAADRNEELVSVHARLAGERMQIVDAVLARQPYVAAPTLTIGDVPLAALMFRYFTMPIERPALPNVERWYAGLTARPSYQTHVMVPWEPMKVPGA